MPPLDELRDDWTALADASGNPFASWEWATTWWRHFGRGRQLSLLTARGADGRAESILPLYVSTRRPARVLRLIGHGASDQLGAVCAPGAQERAAAVLTRALGPDRGCDLFVGDDLPAGGLSKTLPGATVICRTPSPALRIEGRSWDEYLGSRSRNFREQIRARERRLARGRHVRYRLANDPDRLAADMEGLFALHQARWRGAGGSGSFTRRLRRFHSDFAAAALNRGWLRLRVLELDGRPAAALLAFRFGGAEWFYQAGRDPSLDQEAVGFVLLARAVREAFEDGLREYRFLRGAEAYKLRFADSAADVETVAVARTAAGRAALRALTGGRLLPRRARRRLPASLRICNAAPRRAAT